MVVSVLDILLHRASWLDGRKESARVWQIRYLVPQFGRAFTTIIVIVRMKAEGIWRASLVSLVARYVEVGEW
jgi:hypothetical protein